MNNINYIASKKDVTTVPFHLLVEKNANGERLDSLAQDLISAKLGLATQAEWLIPSCLSYIEKNLILVRKDAYDDNGTLRGANLISPFDTLKQYFADNPKDTQWFRGMLVYLTFCPRKQIVGSLVQTRNLEYSALVPLVLSIFKKKRKVQYADWDWLDKGMKYLVDSDMLDAVTLGSGRLSESPLYQLPKEDILRIREYSLMYKTGVKTGECRLPTSTYSITTRTGDSEYNNLPRLRKIMDCQIWVAHQSLRNSLMVLDPINLDNIPEILVPDEINVNSYTKIPSKEEDLPWSIT